MSKTVTQGMTEALMTRVPGLGEMTIKDVFDRFKQHCCICLPFGGSVRQYVINFLDTKDPGRSCEYLQEILEFKILQSSSQVSSDVNHAY